MKTYILAARHQIAELAANELGLSRSEWAYVSDLESARAAARGRNPAVLRLIRVWSPGIPFDRPHQQAAIWWEERGFTVEVVTT